MRAVRARLVASGILLLTLTLTACESAPGPAAPSAPSPTPVAVTPSPGPLPFRTTTYLLQVFGPLLPAVPCQALRDSRLGQTVMTMVEMTFDGVRWRAVAQSPGGGTFDLTFEPGPLVGGGPGGGPGVSGALSGTVVSTVGIGPTLNLDGPVRDLRLTFGGSGVPATLAGGISPDGVIAGGEARGDWVFSNSTGTSASCAGSMGWSVSVRGEDRPLHSTGHS